MGRECPMNIVGTVSEREAKEALIQHKGNMWPAVEECVRQRQKKVGSENTPDVKFIWSWKTSYRITLRNESQPDFFNYLRFMIISEIYLFYM